jgi:hypothetical protein
MCKCLIGAMLQAAKFGLSECRVRPVNIVTVEKGLFGWGVGVWSRRSNLTFGVGDVSICQDF